MVAVRSLLERETSRHLCVGIFFFLLYYLFISMIRESE